MENSYPIKDPSTEATRSAGLAGLAGAGIGYGLFKVIEGIDTKKWALKPSPLTIGLSAVMAATFASFMALINSRKPKLIIAEAVFSINIKGNLTFRKIFYPKWEGRIFKYQRTSIEEFLGAINTLTIVPWMFSNVESKLSKFCMITTGLTVLGSAVFHIVGVNKAEKADQENLTHSEKLALERAAARTANTARAA